MLELGILTPLLDWKRCSQALSRHHHPGFEVHVSLRATAFSIPPNIFSCGDLQLCSLMFVLCLSFALCNLEGVVLELLRLDEICDPLLSFLVWLTFINAFEVFTSSALGVNLSHPSPLPELLASEL